jgi:SAM-dependent methyltransferase
MQTEIPLDEATYYDQVAARQADELSKLDSIERIREVDRSISFEYLARLVLAKDRGNFPYPKQLWIASIYDCLSERDAYEYLAPLDGKKVLQIGGKGFAAIQFMLAGAGEAWLLTPVEAEARCAKELARLAGVQLHCRIGVAEQLPFESNFFDAIHSSGCAHHFQTDRAFPEIARVLREGGRFSAVDPWKAPLYSLGIRVFGKREEAVHCRPLNQQRVEPLKAAFSDYKVIQHGILSRYPIIALEKLGCSTPLEIVWKLTQIDDAVSSLFGLRTFGSSVAILARK